MAEETKSLQAQEAQKQEIMEEGAERTSERLAFVPRVDIYEHEDMIALVADMPGVDENSVDITLEKGILTLRGYVEAEAPEGYSLAYAEYRVGDYERNFTISEQVDQENIEATLKDGVLKINLPRVAPTTRQISVKADA